MTLAASLTGLDVDWIEGWSGHDVHEKALPPDSWGRPMAYDNRGSWRAHMDALRR